MLTKELILQKHSSSSDLSSIKTISMWGSDIENISILKEMPNIEIISLSVNRIRTLSALSSCYKLRELYLRKNLISSLSEIHYLVPLKNLKILWLEENPISKLPNYRQYILTLLPQLVKLDNIPVQCYNTTNPNKTISQIEQRNKEQAPQNLRRVASSIDTTKTPKLIFIKKHVTNASRESKENESFYKFNRVDSKNSFNESKINHNIINSNNKYIHVRSHSSKKNVVYRKLKLKLKASVEQEKNNNSVIKNMKRKIPICRSGYDMVIKKLRSSVSVTHNISSFDMNKDLSNLIDSKEGNNEHIMKAILILIDKMKLNDLMCLKREIDKKVNE